MDDKHIVAAFSTTRPRLTELTTVLHLESPLVDELCHQVAMEKLDLHVQQATALAIDRALAEGARLATMLSCMTRLTDLSISLPAKIWSSRSAIVLPALQNLDLTVAYQWNEKEAWPMIRAPNLRHFKFDLCESGESLGVAADAIIDLILELGAFGTNRYVLDGVRATRGQSSCGADSLRDIYK